ncbi:hypothetical protein CTEN210_09076 [Chaetoceros tenuissimus]|uniref:MYND-type domain-containing protein n=1 Tax=Chaetoceros tenuissimus TaxID=426638 RepID=A0AAD3CX82_9STRA|nr:hypothetical protein CTEN210_09076 [Chaetoceros tenuissimus]
MYDRDLAQIVPEWDSFNKRKKEKIYQKYLVFSRKTENQKEFAEMNEKAHIINHQRCIKMLPSALRKRDTQSLNYIVDDLGFVDGRMNEMEWEKKKVLTMEIWDGAASAFVDALNCRDAMFSIYLNWLYIEFLTAHGRATRVLRKSKLFCPYLKHCLTHYLDNKIFYLIDGGFEKEIYVMVMFSLLGGSLTFVKRLIKEDIPRLLFERIEKCPDVYIIHLLEAIRQCIVLLANYKEEEGLKHSIIDIISKGYVTLLQRALKINYTKNEPNFEGIANKFAETFVYLQVYFKLPTLLKLREKFTPFGMEFYKGIRDITNPNFYSCQLVTVDFAKEDASDGRKSLRKVFDGKNDEFERYRNVNIHCGYCKKEEPEDTLFSRCTKCKMIYYCNRDCQVKGWKHHKSVCKALPKTSLKEPLRNGIEGMVHTAIEEMDMPARGTKYPTPFAVWLEEKYGSKE